ncbi:lambda-crystallin [Parasteatoda tepidariorum]|uniref:lambda-crystallin n=1 Tax=Parasteatoda tepidariorum TaxID=114398 RepID=UPI001C71A8B3|nr:lambda-crystallin [Parasteatoda tepidariorum]
MSVKGKVGIVGSGFIGRGWAMLFASTGYSVGIYDVESFKVDEALADIKIQLQKLKELGYLRGKLSETEQFNLIHKCNTLEECVSGSIHVQECVFENVELKKEVFKDMDKYVSKNGVLCSSTSCFPASSFTEELVHRSQVVVGHPVNPPYYVPLVEIVPAPWTDPSVVDKTRALMAEIGQKPVVLKKELPGFALNRIQYALIDECYRIYQDGIMSLEDIETSICDGLGLRYAFIGPLETCHLNAEGMRDYCNRYGEGIYKVSQTFGPNPLMEGEELQRLDEDICKISPLEKMSERRQWRDARLSALSKMKRVLEESEKAQ